MEELGEWAAVEEVIQSTCLANGPAARGPTVNSYTGFKHWSRCHGDATGPGDG